MCMRLRVLVLDVIVAHEALRDTLRGDSLGFVLQSRFLALEQPPQARRGVERFEGFADAEKRI